MKKFSGFGSSPAQQTAKEKFDLRQASKETAKKFVEDEGCQMLVLTRRVDDVIHIGDDIQIMITEIQGNQVKVAVTAPPNVKIYRDEIYQRIQQEKGNVNGNV